MLPRRIKAKNPVSIVHLMPAVSVIIPAYNSAEYLEVALSSVAAQSFRDFEVIVVDDNSRDGTKDLAVRLLKKYGLMGSAFVRPEAFQKGAGGARNAGAAAASGRVLAFLDSDDAWESQHLRRAVSALKPGDSNVVAYCSQAEACHQRTGKTHMMPHGGYPCYGASDLRKVLLSGMIIPNVTLCVESESFHRVGGYAENLSCYEDWWLVLGLASMGRFFVDDFIGCHVWIRDSSLSHTTDSRGAPVMNKAMFRDALRLVGMMRTQGKATKEELSQLEKSVASFIVPQLVMTLRSKMLKEFLAVFGSVVCEMHQLPRLTVGILKQFFGLTFGLAWRKLICSRVAS